MPQSAYYPYQDLRSLQAVSIPAFSALAGTAELLTAPPGFVTRLVALNIAYSLDVATLTTRDIFLQIVDATGDLIVGSDASVAISTSGITPSPDTQVSFGVGFFGAQAGAGDGVTFQTFTLGILDLYMPDGWKYVLRQTGFGGSDKVLQSNGLVEYLDNRGDISGNSGGNHAADFSALAYLLNHP